MNMLERTADKEDNVEHHDMPVHLAGKNKGEYLRECYSLNFDYSQLPLTTPLNRMKRK